MDQSAPGERKVRDILDMLLTATDENGQGLTQLEMRNEVDTFLFAGHETTATGISWTLYALASNPEYQDRVYEEVMEVMGDRDNIEWEDLSKLEFTTMCIKEAMRLHGAVPFIERRTVQECTIRGYTIPEGTRVFILLYTLHHNPHLWDEPEEFIPERFHPDKTRYMNPYQFIPFAAGARNCIGQNFAMNEMKTVIAKTVRNFRLTFNPKYPVCRIPSVTIKSQTGLYLQATPRL